MQIPSMLATAHPRTTTHARSARSARSVLVHGPPGRTLRVHAESADMRDMNLPDSAAAPPYVLPMFRRFSELFGPKLPADIAYETVNVGHTTLDKKLPFRCSYDEGFGGHFSVPGVTSAAIKFDAVMAEPDPFAFLKSHLRFHPSAGGVVSDAAADEIVIFSPGLNTLHMLRPGWEAESTTPQRLQRYIDILQRPMVQMHIGTDMDQGDAAVFEISDRLLGFLNANRPLLKRFGFNPPVFDGKVSIPQRQRDYMEVAMSAIGFARPMYQMHMLELLEFNETAQQPIVLMPYSRTTAELSSAIRRYKEGFVKRYVKEHGRMSGRRGRREVENLLRKTLTVVSFGNIDRRWVDGPAYVHVASVSDRPMACGTDVLNSALGVSSKKQRFAGDDAVFLNYDGVYSGGEPHNLGAVGVQAIRIAMKLNGADTFRGLWEKGQEGPLEVPSREQLTAAAVVTDSEKWLFSPETAGRDLLPWPSRSQAEDILAGVW